MWGRREQEENKRKKHKGSKRKGEKKKGVRKVNFEEETENPEKWEKGIYKYFSGKRKTRKNGGPLLKETGDQVTWDSGKAEVLNEFFGSVFNSKTGLQESQVPDARPEKMYLVEEE